MIKAWMKRLFNKGLPKAVIIPPRPIWDGVDMSIELEEDLRRLARRMNPTPEERDRIRQVEEFKDSAMLGQKDKYITVEYRSGQVYLDPYKGIKSYWLGDKKIWQNPDYEKGGRYYE